MKKHCSTDGLCNAEGNQPCNLKQKLTSLWRRFSGWMRSLFTRRTALFALAGWLALGAFAASAAAQSKEPLAITLTSQKVVLQDGKETLAAAGKARPGDVIQYAAVYRNTSAQPLRDMQPLLPIPAGMQYLPNSAQPAPTHASLDGRAFEPIPLKRIVKLADGSIQEQVVPASEYRALRWSFAELPAGASTNITARAQLTIPTIAINK